jgi:hypothetical protein
MNDKESNPHPQPKTLRAHKFNATIQGRQLFFELPADFPLGEIEVIVLADENQTAGHGILRQGQSDGLSESTRLARLRHAQALIQQYAMGDDTSPVDELIAERRAEAASE